MTLYLLVREYEDDRTTILGIYSTLNLAQIAISGLTWEELDSFPVQSWGAKPDSHLEDRSLFVIYELVLNHLVDIF
ncbi:MAG: hypothetical protein K8I82_23050 [Anaerolineae bacterium]|nr:hypothetical protein [Anaerolineae bacterium]